MQASWLQLVRIKARLAEGLRRAENGCLEWQGRTDQGYGITSFQARRWLVHRLAWTLEKGGIPEGKSLCHKCDNRRCADLDHLFLGTRADNVADMDRKGRRGFASELRPKDVRRIRKLRKQGYSYREIGEEVGCSKDVAYQVCSGATWSHIK